MNSTGHYPETRWRHKMKFPINEPFAVRRLKHSNDSILGTCLFWGVAILFTAWLVTHMARSSNPAFDDLRTIKNRVYAALSGEAK